MLKGAAILVAALATVLPAAACPYVADDGRKMEFVESSTEPLVVLTAANGETSECFWMRSAEGTGLRLSCDDGTHEFFERVDGAEPPTISFHGVMWLRACPEAADSNLRPGMQPGVVVN